MFVVMAGGYMFLSGPEKNLTTSPAKPAELAIPSDAVTITPLPSLRIIRGTEVPFEGKTELRQVIDGRFAQNIVVVNFQATGEHAEKSVIKIVWENGEVEKVYPGTRNKKIVSDKRAVEISISGYSMHERRVFKDSSRKGTLTWEIRYEPVE